MNKPWINIGYRWMYFRLQLFEYKETISHDWHIFYQIYVSEDKEIFRSLYLIWNIYATYLPALLITIKNNLFLFENINTLPPFNAVSTLTSWPL